MTRRGSKLSVAARRDLLRFAAGGSPRLRYGPEWQLRDAGFIAGFDGTGPSITAAGVEAARIINERIAKR